ncbi:CopG family transcriptional regulator [Cyanobacterium aponinum FACHB-4101]|uniref:type II toxin-antitoxin system BrnA family antitoxin n=1 Tax=Cyanobacterium aponinum TaxID=379064 RepID=UPI00168167E9|nr:CopG family antitoxin [Cyanobacterium aponinum]MBD2395479.1 CopG family transcriptional regulator [Cyanobacterium aponinum FACHB-4101]
MKAKEFDHKFDQGEDIIPYLDLTQAKRPLKELKQSLQQKQPLNIELPKWMIDQLNQQAQQQGVNTNALIQSYLLEHLILL